MKQIIVFLLVLVLSVPLFADFDGPGAASRAIPVSSIRSLRDDDKVTLEGFLVKQLSEEHYLFRDDSGEIEVEIDEEDFRGIRVTETTAIRIYGEVDKDWNSLSIEVDYLELIPE